MGDVLVLPASYRHVGHVRCPRCRQARVYSAGGRDGQCVACGADVDIPLRTAAPIAPQSVEEAFPTTVAMLRELQGAMPMQVAAALAELAEALDRATELAEELWG